MASMTTSPAWSGAKLSIELREPARKHDESSGDGVDQTDRWKCSNLKLLLHWQGLEIDHVMSVCGEEGGGSGPYFYNHQTRS